MSRAAWEEAESPTLATKERLRLVRTWTASRSMGTVRFVQPLAPGVVMLVQMTDRPSTERSSSVSAETL